MKKQDSVASMKTIAAQKTSDPGRQRSAPDQGWRGRDKDVHLFRASHAQNGDSAILVVYDSFPQQQARCGSNPRKGPGPSLGRKTAS
jgi:hypothetical protein